MRTFESLKKELLKDKEVAKEYKRLAPKYELMAQLIEARLKKGLSQKQLAEKVGTKQSAIARLEGGRANPTLSFLEKVTQALDSNLRIQID